MLYWTLAQCSHCPSAEWSNGKAAQTSCCRNAACDTWCYRYHSRGCSARSRLFSHMLILLWWRRSSQPWLMVPMKHAWASWMNSLHLVWAPKIQNAKLCRRLHGGFASALLFHPKLLTPRATCAKKEEFFSFPHWSFSGFEMWESTSINHMQMWLSAWPGWSSIICFSWWWKGIVD